MQTPTTTQAPNRRRRKVLVLGSDSGGFLSVIRSLGRRGIEVHIAWCPDGAPASRSRYVHRVHRVSRPSTGNGWLEEFSELLRRERFDLVLPTDDPSLIPLQLNRTELEPHGRLYVLDDHAFAVTFDKIMTRRLAEEVGVPVAPGDVVTDVDEIDAVVRSRPYPLVIKPQSSYTAGDLDRRNSVAKVQTESEARIAISERLQQGHVLVEENVNGTGWGVEVLVSSGEILLAQQHERLHEPLEGGGSSYRRTVHLDPGFMDVVTSLLRALRYTGVAMFEFKGDPENGEWILIEINGRFWGSLPLSLSAGIDFPYALWELLVGGRTHVRNEYRVNVFGRNVKRDLKWLWLNLRADRSDPALATRDLSTVAGELGNMVSGREHTDQFTVDDPAPGMVEFGELGLTFWDHLRTFVLEHSPLRWRLRRRARAALRSASAVMFVCYGNICRSPFAAQLARQALPRSVEVFSAGTSADAGRRTPSIARDVARELGVDLEDHQSVTITEELVSRADAIFAFDEHNLRELRRRFPKLRRKLHLLGALGAGPLIVVDPLNGDAGHFRSVYGMIADALAAGRAV